MTTKLDKALKREITIGGHPYVVTLDPEGLSLVLKGKRKGMALDWVSLVNGDEALARALTAALANAPDPPARKLAKKARGR